MDMRGRKRGRGREGELGVRVCWDVGEREGRYEVFLHGYVERERARG
jgi:hypothetical protein